MSAASTPVVATMTNAELWRFGLAAFTELRRRQNVENLIALTPEISQRLSEETHDAWTGEPRKDDDGKP